MFDAAKWFDLVSGARDDSETDADSEVAAVGEYEHGSDAGADAGQDSGPDSAYTDARNN